MVSIIPLAPLNSTMGLCIGAMSYDGKICWGLTGDPDLIPDIDLLAQMIADSTANALGSVRAKAPRQQATPKHAMSRQRQLKRGPDLARPEPPKTVAGRAIVYGWLNRNIETYPGCGDL